MIGPAMHPLIPVSNVQHGFTTSSSLASLDGLKLCSLKDKSLGVHKVFTKTTHRVVTPPSETCSAWEAFYPRGSINPKGETAGGFGFYLSGPPSFLGDACDIKRDVVMSYHVKFQDHWEWALGGKLPGVCELNFHLRALGLTEVKSWRRRRVSVWLYRRASATKIHLLQYQTNVAVCSFFPIVSSQEYNITLDLTAKENSTLISHLLSLILML